MIDLPDDLSQMIIPMPKAYYGLIYNACNEPCDMRRGPCACGAWHQDSIKDFLRKEINSPKLIETKRILDL